MLTQNNGQVDQISAREFAVVGIGASAGGLEAFKSLIHAIPEDSGMAFIVVQHLAPDHYSYLSELLQHTTKIPVTEITQHLKVEPNQIYIIPPNKLVTVIEGMLQLKNRVPKPERNMPVDMFFTSLAEAYQNRAIGVVLSGSASDGTLGLTAIRNHGGITFAQEQGSAAFDGMPQSAIDAEVVDFILTPEAIAHKLISLSAHFSANIDSTVTDLKVLDETFPQLLEVVRTSSGVDFSNYKQTTIQRRILRRFKLSGLESVADYLLLIRSNKEEQHALYNDLLISVTDFFRDTVSFGFLGETIFPLLANDRQQADTLRVWNAGCSTGQETYSMAICALEYFESKALRMKLQMFATDISEKVIAKARAGVYTKRELSSVSDERLEKYFTKLNNHYQIKQVVRECCVFSIHNFLKDPPYSHIDLISCRNVLIYMEPSLQKKALTTFHYGLNTKGYLMLGKSETYQAAADLFTTVDKTEHIYLKKYFAGRPLPLFDVKPTGNHFQKSVPIHMKEIIRSDYSKIADDYLLTHSTPPGVIINSQLDIVQFRGSTGAWLEPPPGKPSLNIIKMARPELAFELRRILQKARAINEQLFKEEIAITSTAGERKVMIEIIALRNTQDPYFLILFKEGAVLHDANNKFPVPIVPPSNGSEQYQVSKLKNEIVQLREDMRIITEEQEAVNQDLQSANEELLSGSEELQSLNEELETSKEEIQSSNEELTALNQELFERNDQLNLSRVYAEAIISTIREPVIIFDKNMIVRTANRAYYAAFGAKEATEGSSFYKLNNGHWNIPSLHQLVETIIEQDATITDFELTGEFSFLGTRTLLINGTRLFQTSNTDPLILLAIQDITEFKRADAAIKQLTQELEHQVEERTSELKESNELLRRSNEHLAQFATIASHDLQEPLRKVKTFASILNQRHSQEVNPEGLQLLTKITLAAERMSNLIKDLLVFSKVTGELLAFEKTNLNDIIQLVIGDFELLINEKDALVSHDILPVIDAVPLLMNQLFYNLLSNALKFSEAGQQPQIVVSCSVLPEARLKDHPDLRQDRIYYEIVLTDNGIGFDPQFSEQIFQIFERLNPGDLYEGTGIGLALCKNIMSSHQGKIFAESQNFMGARFYLIFPAEL